MPRKATPTRAESSPELTDRTKAWFKLLHREKDAVFPKTHRANKNTCIESFTKWRGSDFRNDVDENMWWAEIALKECFPMAEREKDSSGKVTLPFYRAVSMGPSKPKDSEGDERKAKAPKLESKLGPSESSPPLRAPAPSEPQPPVTAPREPKLVDPALNKWLRSLEPELTHLGPISYRVVKYLGDDLPPEVVQRYIESKPNVGLASLARMLACRSEFLTVAAKEDRDARAKTDPNFRPTLHEFPPEPIRSRGMWPHPVIAVHCSTLINGDIYFCLRFKGAQCEYDTFYLAEEVCRDSVIDKIYFFAPDSTIRDWEAVDWLKIQTEPPMPLLKGPAPRASEKEFVRAHSEKFYKQALEDAKRQAVP